VVGLSLQAPAASAGVARAAAASHAAAAQAHAGRAAASAHHPAIRLKPVVRAAVRHDTSPPLRSMKPLRKITSNKLKVLPLRSPPHMIGGSAQARTADVQRAATLTTENMPSFGQNFEGVGNLNGVLPPDTNMAVGPNDIMQVVNFSFAV